MASASFYSQIAANRRNSFLLGIVVVVLLGVLGSAIGYAWSGSSGGAVTVTVIALIVGALAALGSYYAGDQVVLGVSGAKEIGQADAPVLFDVVKELSIAAGVPMPRVYIIDDSAPNAFATGRDPRHASVAVTSGLLAKLDREELAGVLGHELSHVRNYDIRFSLLVGVLVGSIALLADFFLRMTFWGGMGGGRRSDDREGGGGGGLQALVFVVAIILAILAPIAARLVQLAVSRQREYLADASSVELTRNPYGLERALEVIAEDQEPLEVANRATQHLYFANPIKKLGGTSVLFSTHPPIVDRINRLRQLSGERPLSGSEAAPMEGLE
ncbi:MAG TPA: zinc metalloprotease HtpX [Candidatus Limnocylindrales bacterium]